jgi:hypothetical protein
MALFTLNEPALHRTNALVSVHDQSFTTRGRIAVHLERLRCHVHTMKDTAMQESLSILDGIPTAALLSHERALMHVWRACYLALEVERTASLEDIWAGFAAAKTIAPTRPLPVEVIFVALLFGAPDDVPRLEVFRDEADVRCAISIDEHVSQSQALQVMSNSGLDRARHAGQLHLEWIWGVLSAVTLEVPEGRAVLETLAERLNARDMPSSFTRLGELIATIVNVYDALIARATVYARRSLHGVMLDFESEHGPTPGYFQAELPLRFEILTQPGLRSLEPDSNRWRMEPLEAPFVHALTILALNGGSMSVAAFDAVLTTLVSEQDFVWAWPGATWTKRVQHLLEQRQLKILEQDGVTTRLTVPTDATEIDVDSASLVELEALTSSVRRHLVRCMLHGAPEAVQVAWSAFANRVNALISNEAAQCRSRGDVAGFEARSALQIAVVDRQMQMH